MKGKVLRTLLLAFVASLLLAGTADASRWVGKATNLKGDFNYGKVTFTVKGGYMRDLEIRGVTTQSSTIPYTTVAVPKVRIRGGRFSAKYVPVPGIKDIIDVGGRINGSVARGWFHEGPLIPAEGRFTARKR